jgi:regulation of enolase protein 1 (concanavalin A-like superfamily)
VKPPITYAMISAQNMQRNLIHETFASPVLHPALKWLNPPPAWEVDPLTSRLVIHPASQTDFWQRTHYGFRVDNGHLLYTEVSGDAVITARIHSFPVHQFDQAGLMVRFSDECWLKTSVEFEPDGASHLGAVVTNYGYSDWSLQDFLRDGTRGYSLRVRCEREDYLVEYADEESGPWRLLRVAHLRAQPALPGWAGVYACSPKGAGFRAEIEYLKIEASSPNP